MQPRMNRAMSGPGVLALPRTRAFWNRRYLVRAGQPAFSLLSVSFPRSPFRPGVISDHTPEQTQSAHHPFSARPRLRTSLIFLTSLKYMAGDFVDRPPSDFGAYLNTRFPDAKNICSAVPEYAGNKKPEDYNNWADASDIDVTIVRALLEVAETGSVLLRTVTFGSPQSAFLLTIS